MGTVFVRALVFTVSAALILFLWTLLTFEMPRLPVTAAWQQRAVAQGALLGAIAAAGFVGACTGFALQPRGAALRRKTSVALGFVFAVLVFLVLPFATTVGAAGTAGIALLLAAGVVLLGGRAFSVRT